MKKIILALTMVATMMVSSAITVMADVTTGLVGQYNFDGNLKNEVTGEEAKLTGRYVNSELKGDEKAEYVNGVLGDSLWLDGIMTSYGVELVDCAPDTNTFTFSYDIFYTKYTQHSPALFLSTSWEEEDAQWVSFGVGHQADLSYAAGVWVHDVVNENPLLWVDAWKAGGVPSLVNDKKEWRYWVNITYTVENGVAKIYVNGEDLGVVPTNLTADTSIVNTVTEASRLFVGVNAFDYPISAAIDNLCVYDRALTADDVKELYSSRDYAVAIEPIKEQEKIEPLEKNTAGAEQMLKETEATEPTTEDESEFPVYEVLLVAVILVIVAIIVALFVVVIKKKPDYGFDDDDL